jgi:glycerol-3-phosphate dehydrogenase (NAD(P)+)
MKAVIIGGGELGLSFAKALLLSEKKGLAVEIWDKDPQKCSTSKTLKETLEGADFVFLCIPSWGLKEFLKKSVSLVGRKSIIIPFAKGLFAPKPLAAYFKKLKRPWVIVSGPMLAEEMGDGLPAFGLVAANSKEIFSKFKKLFEGSKIQLEYSVDAYGVSLIGVVKNIYAIWLGAADGLDLGGNFKGIMAGRAILEMIKLEEVLKIKKETIFNANNFGDLIATGFSSGSCNRRFGEALAKNQKIDLKCEGAGSLPFLIKILGEKKAKKFPLLWSLNKAILSNRK